MALDLADYWVWDFWLADERTQQHLFYLHAPRTEDPEDRHQQARIGHAVSQDLRSWTVLPRPLPDSAPGAIDDRATWTGSTILDHDGRWHMFYTGVSSAEGGQVQRILSATSDDLTTWARTDVVVEADSAWYEKWTPELSEEHWRDPWIHWDEPARLWRMYLTARVRTGSPDGRGVIAQATSTDLASWSVQPPVTVPGDYRQMEVSQLVEVPTGYALLFCHGPTDNSAERLARIGGQAEGGMHLLFASLPEGPFVRESDDFFLRGAPPELYAARIVEHRAERYLLGWSTESNGVFAGGVSDPIRFAVDADNTIRLGRIAR